MTRKHLLLGSVSALTMGLLVAPAFAQDDSAVETVVVTGIRASLQSAQAIKQNSDQVVDSITAVDIGALPDRNVADALQRVPGVTLQRTDQARDPVRYGGTGNNVFIRGLSWTQAMTNGRDAFSASGGRDLNFADVSADLLSGVDVFKNPTAKMIEGGVGGTIDLKTRKPFDQDGQVVALSVDGTYAVMNERGTFSGNALYSNRWSTKIGEIGALLSVDWQDQRNRVNGISASEYYCVDLTGSGYSAGSDECNALDLYDSSGNMQKGFVPGALGPRQVDWQQQRFATDFVAQWRPNEKVEVTLEVLNAIANPNDVEHTVLFYPEKSAGTSYNYTFDKNGTWVGGDFTAPWTMFDTRVGKHHNRTTDASLNIKYNPNDSWAFTADAQFIESVATSYSMTAYTSYSMQDISFDYSGSMPKFTIADTDIAETSVGIDAYMDHLEYNVAHAGTYRADATYTFPKPLFDVLKTVSFGFRGSNKLSVMRQTGYGWRNLWWGYMNANQGNLLENFEYGDLLGNSGLWAVMFKPSALRGGEAAVQALQAANLGTSSSFYATSAGCTGGGEHCLAAYEGLTPGSDNQASGINSVREDIYSGYLMADFASDTFLGFDVPVDGNIGVRVINTRDKISEGKLVISALTQTCTVGSSITDTTSADYGHVFTTADCADYNEALAYMGGTSAVSTYLPSTSNSYTDVLPSFNMRWHLTDQLQARVAYSQGMVRPRFDQMINFATVGFNFQTNLTQYQGTFKAGELGLTGTAGNPDLKPMHAQQYDASIEWYFSATGSLTFAMFHKDLANYFYSATEARDITNPDTDETATFYVTTTKNGSKGKVEGFEFGYTQFFDSLPGAWNGLGLQVNYTKIYNSGGANGTVNIYESAQVTNATKDLPLEGMSNDSYNIAALYSKYGFDVRLAYNWRSRYLLTSSAANVKQPIWSENFGQLDGSIFYSFMDHYKIGIQATNLLDATTKLSVGYTGDVRPYNWLKTDQKVSFILRANW